MSKNNKRNRKKKGLTQERKDKIVRSLLDKAEQEDKNKNKGKYS